MLEVPHSGGQPATADLVVGAPGPDHVVGPAEATRRARMEPAAIRGTTTLSPGPR